MFQFNLGCQNWKRTLIGSIHNAGLFVSLPLTGFISDKYGRKLALSIASLMNSIFGFLRSFSVNYPMMLVFEFLEAALGAGAYSTAFVIGKLIFSHILFTIKWKIPLSCLHRIFHKSSLSRVLYFQKYKLSNNFFLYMFK